MSTTRRRFLRDAAVSAVTATAASHLALAALDEIAPFRTPYKYPKLILSATGNKGDFDERSVDDPIVFYANGAFRMLYIGWDGIGYQTGLATSTDLVHWTRTALVAPRNPSSKYTRYNLALSSILRNKQLRSNGEAIKVNGKYLGAWNAIPAPVTKRAQLLSVSPPQTIFSVGSSPIPSSNRRTAPPGSTAASTVPTSCSTAEPTTSTTTPRPTRFQRSKAEAGTNRLVSQPRPTSKPGLVTGRIPSSATVHAAAQPIPLRTQSPQPNPRHPTLATVASPRTPSSFRTAATSPCSTLALATSVRPCL